MSQITREMIIQACAKLKENGIRPPYFADPEPHEISPGVFLNFTPGTGFKLSDDEGNPDDVLIESYLQHKGAAPL